MISVKARPIVDGVASARQVGGRELLIDDSCLLIVKSLRSAFSFNNQKTAINNNLTQ
jgi:hypothetical protein